MLQIVNSNARKQYVDGIQYSIMERYEDTRDKSLDVHFVLNRVIPAGGIMIPSIYDGCSDEGKNDWYNFKTLMNQQNIYPFLIVQSIEVCTNATDPRVEGENQNCECNINVSGLATVGAGSLLVKISPNLLDSKNAITFLHEIGHNCGLEDAGSPYNIMNMLGSGTGIAVAQRNLLGIIDLQVWAFTMQMPWEIYR